MTDEPQSPDPESPVPLSFAALSRLFIPRGALNTPAELHGMLCGKLAGGGEPDPARWREEAVEFLDLTDAPDASVVEALDGLLDNAREQMASPSFELALLLPDDQQPLNDRVEALGDWCRGFLNGFGSAGISGDSRLSGEVADTLRDLAAIAQVDAEESRDEHDEANFTELAEYVRMAALSLHLEFAGPAAGPGEPAQPDTLH